MQLAAQSPDRPADERRNVDDCAHAKQFSEKHHRRVAVWPCELRVSSGHCRGGVGGGGSGSGFATLCVLTSVVNACCNRARVA